MSDIYPRENELLAIKEWNFLKKSIQDFLCEIKRLWHWEDWGYKLSGKRVLRLELHTGGWSGNESIIEALRDNFVFWTVCWIKSQRGGHYWFEIKLKLFNEGKRGGAA